MGRIVKKTTEWGEDRYYAIITHKGRIVHIGWYTTERRAQKAINNAEEP